MSNDESVAAHLEALRQHDKEKRKRETNRTIVVVLVLGVPALLVLGFLLSIPMILGN